VVFDVQSAPCKFTQCNAHDLTSSLGLIGNSILMSTQQGVTSPRGREFSSSPGKKISGIEKKDSRLLTSLLSAILQFADDTKTFLNVMTAENGHPSKY